jgi:hypothetical protein
MKFASEIQCNFLVASEDLLAAQPRVNRNEWSKWELKSRGQLTASQKRVLLQRLAAPNYVQKWPHGPNPNKLLLAVSNLRPHASLLSSDFTSPFSCLLRTH